MTDITEEQQISIFEERAENLSKDELEGWTCLSHAEQQVLDKLKGPGAKLLSGPRGSGKSTLLRRAYYELCHTGNAVPIYVNYSKSLAIEPLFQKRANAIELFRQWVFAKLLVGIKDTNNDFELDLGLNTKSLIRQAQDFIGDMEAGNAPDAAPFSLGPSKILSLMQEIADGVGVARCVLLLDDAAHAFSFRQQREFFEIFRELRSRHVSAKAAIYPGITSFSPNFHVGHEAEILEAWLSPTSPTFLPTMRDIAAKRVPNEYLEILGSNQQEYIDLLALASFGLPRGFLNMLSAVIDEAAKPGTARLRNIILDTIAIHAESVEAVFSNLSLKLPRFVHYVEIGQELNTDAQKKFKKFNIEKPLRTKAATLALAMPSSNELEKILKMLEYSGLVRRQPDLSKGEKGQYQRYLFHYASLIAANSFSLGRAYKLEDLVEALSHRSAHALIKVKPETLVGSNYERRCVLALPPCSKCDTARTSEDQRFCMNCGAELANTSLYVDLLNTSISKLPLPQAKISAILANTPFRKIQDLIADDEHRLMKPGSYIGPVWAKRIKTVAEEFLSV